MKKLYASLAMLAFLLMGCASLRSTVATVVPGIRLTLTVASLPPLTQTAMRVPTRYVPMATATPQPVKVSPQPTQLISPISTRTPRPTSTTVAWSVSWVEFKAVYPYVRYASWIDNSRIKLTYGPYREFVVDAASGLELTSTPYPTSIPGFSEYERYLFSPDGVYVFECSDVGLRLLRASDKQVIGQSSIQVLGCYLGDWAGDSSKAAFPTNYGAIYIWSVIDSAPRHLEYSRFAWSVRWSPDGQRLLLVTSSAQGRADGAAVYIVNQEADSTLDLGIEVEDGNHWDPSYVNWATDEIIVNHRRGLTWYYYAYYDIHTRQLITSASLDEFQTQGERRSPNNRWFVLDQSGWPSERRFAYNMLDLQTRTVRWLSDGTQTHLDFIGWSDDSSTFYLVSRPVSETAKSNSNTPFGLLALNPGTHEFTQLFEQAVFASWSPDKHLMWVVFPAKREDGSLGLDGGIFAPATGTLTGRAFVSDHVLYANPAEGDLVPVAWSNDGTRLVFGDSRGNLNLLGTDGLVQTLASNLPHIPWPQDVHHAWSPDDRRLLVQHGDRAWIVNVP